MNLKYEHYHASKNKLPNTSHEYFKSHCLKLEINTEDKWHKSTSELMKHI